MSVNVKLIITWKDEERQPQTMERFYPKKTVHFGRDIRNDVCIPDRFVSNYHARMELQGDRYRLFDLGSTNGTCLNGKRIKQNGDEIIKNGDIIKIADHEIEFRAEKADDNPPGLPSLQQAAYHTLCTVLSAFFPQRLSFKSEEDLKNFGQRIQGILEIFIHDFQAHLETYSKLQYELDIQETHPQKHNPVTAAQSARELTEYLLDWENDDNFTVLNFLKEACADLSRSQKATLKTLEDCLPAMLEEIGPQSVQRSLDDRKEDTSKGYLDKILTNAYKDLWNEYLERHKEYLENKNKRFQIIRREFQKIYPEIINQK